MSNGVSEILLPQMCHPKYFCFCVHSVLGSYGSNTFLMNSYVGSFVSLYSGQSFFGLFYF